MHPWRGRSRPPQNTIPIKDPETVLADRHPQLVACESFFERPIRSFSAPPGPTQALGSPWARTWRKLLESYPQLEEPKEKATSGLLEGRLWHAEIRGGEISGIAFDERLYAHKILLPALGREGEAKLIEACRGEVRSVDALLEGEVSDSVFEQLTAPGALLPPLERLRWRCQCGQRGMCEHVAMSLLASIDLIEEDAVRLFVLRRTAPEVLKGLLPDGLTLHLPKDVTVLDETEVSRVFDLALYRPAPLPELVSEQTDGPPEGPDDEAVDAPLAEVAPMPESSGSWLDEDWDDDDDDDDSDEEIYGGAGPTGDIVRARPRAMASDEDMPDIGRSDLLELGLPSHKIQKMLSDGHLLRTPKRGRYLITPEGWEQIEPLLPQN